VFSLKMFDLYVLFELPSNLFRPSSVPIQIKPELSCVAESTLFDEMLSIDTFIKFDEKRIEKEKRESFAMCFFKLIDVA